MEDNPEGRTTLHRFWCGMCRKPGRCFLTRQGAELEAERHRLAVLRLSGQDHAPDVGGVVLVSETMNDEDAATTLLIQTDNDAAKRAKAATYRANRKAEREAMRTDMADRANRHANDVADAKAAKEVAE